MHTQSSSTNSLEGDPLFTDGPGTQPSDRTLSYADLGYPWPAAPTPNAAWLDAQAREWVRAHVLVEDAELAQRFDPINIGLLTASTYPGADPDLQLLFAHLLAWIFLQDDEVDDARNGHDPERLAAVYGRYIAILDGGAPTRGAPPADHALADLRARISEGADPQWLDWFRESMRGFWIDGVVAETRLRSLGVVPSGIDYLRMREHSIGLLPFIDFVELAYHLRIPRVVVGDPTWARLRRRTARIVTLANDVFSYEKEQRAGDANNLVHILRHARGASLADAVDCVVRLHDREVQRFQSDALGAHYLRDVPDLARYLDGMRHWMRGALDWQRASRRYARGRELLDRTASTPSSSGTPRTPRA